MDYLEKNPTFRENWTNIMCKKVLKDKFGDGIA